MTWLRAGLRELPGFILPKTKKKSAPPSPRRRLKTKRKNKKNGATVRKEREKGGKEENGGYFQFQLHRWLKYSTAFQNLLTAAEVPQEALLVWNSTAGTQTCTCAPSHSGTWRHAKMKQTHRQQLHEPNKFCGRSTNTNIEVRDEDLPLPKSQNPAEVWLWVRKGRGSLSKCPHT